MAHIGAEAGARAELVVALGDRLVRRLRAAKNASDDFRFAEAREHLREAGITVDRLEEAEKEGDEFRRRELDRILGRTAGGEAQEKRHGDSGGEARRGG